MDASNRDVPVAAMHLVLQTAAGLGLSRADLLEEIGVAEDQLADRDGSVAIEQQIHLGRLVAAKCPGVNIGLAALKYTNASMLGVLRYVVGHSAVLGDALEAFIRYQHLLSRALHWAVEREPEPRITIVAAPPMQALGFPLETQVGLWIVIGRELTGVHWTPRLVRLRHHPAGPTSEFKERYGCPVEFGAAVNELSVSRDQLTLPIVGARPELQPSLIQLARTVQARTLPPEDHTSRVRALLLEQVPKGMTTKEKAARHLGFSGRTLTRRLQDEGASFRELLEDAREQLARAWMTDPATEIHEVAYLLGYSDPSTFHRSFRRWTGTTPTVWRRTHASGLVCKVGGLADQPDP
ncbi:MAG: AraC family transcriptional regulator [Nannocystaceae bacterium]|nr:AraC family transcriptional regulator [Nannocystaceae bacterium]